MLQELLAAQVTSHGGHAQLAEVLGVARQTVYRWLSGVTEPGDRELAHLLDVLDVDADVRRQIWAERWRVDLDEVRRVVGA